MKRILIYAAAFTLIAAALIPANSATARTDQGNSPHVDSTVQFPQTKWRIVRHTIRLHVPQKSSALSQVILDVPVGLTASNDIILSDSSGQKINANVSINGRQVTLAFPQPIASETKLDIDLNNVKISGVSNAWLYRVSALFVGLDRELPLGVAQFKVY
ncbi:MAG TPA: hypothetical protein V6C91_18910 [Coleofasciculaceae cyanobacterium]